MIYVDRTTGTWGTLEDLILLPDDAEKLLVDTSDSIITTTADVFGHSYHSTTLSTDSTDFITVGFVR